MNTHTDITQLLDLQSWRQAIIPLETDHRDYAVQLSQTMSQETHQWRTYINGLAYCGFIEWLEERAPGVLIQAQKCSILHPQEFNSLNTVCNLSVGELTLCLIVTESVANEWVNIPKAVVEDPDLLAHLYVLLEVQEEQEQIVLQGCLRYDQWLRYQQKVHFLAQSEQNFTVPLDWFDPDFNHLMGYLKFLSPDALPLPQALSQSLQLDEPLSELNLPIIPQPVEKQSAFSQSFVNVWNWSQNLLDTTVQALSWSLPQSLTPAFAMRRSPEKVEAALQDLIHHQGLEIPQDARYSYADLVGTPFQFCAVTWLLPTHPPIQEWALLFILVARPGKVLPIGTKLQVSTTTLLTEATLKTVDLYLYAQVEGGVDESFTPTILLPHANPLTLPTFVCHPIAIP